MEGEERGGRREVVGKEGGGRREVEGEEGGGEEDESNFPGL